MPRTQLTRKQQMFVSRQIAGLVRAGQPIAGELTATIPQAAPRLWRAAKQVDDDLNAGMPLVMALAHSEDPSGLAACIESGLGAGCLDHALDGWVAMQLANQRATTALCNAMLYPVLLIGIMLLSLGMVVWRLVPEYRGTYELFDQRLPYWLDMLSWMREQLGPLLIVLGVLPMLPLLIWALKRRRYDAHGAPKEPARLLRRQALAAELGAHMLAAGNPLSQVAQRCVRIVCSNSRPDAVWEQLQRQQPLPGVSAETSMLLAALHANVIDRKLATENLFSAAGYLEAAAEAKATEQVRWLPMLIALSVGGVVVASYVLLIYLPWILLLHKIVNPN